MKALQKLFTILLAFIISTTIASSIPVTEVYDSNFEDTVFGTPGKKYSFVLFYSPFCQHCKDLEPHFNPLAELYQDTKLQIFKINAIENKSIAKKYGLVGFPVMKLFDAADGQQVGFFKGIKTTAKIVDYLQEATGVKPNYPPKSVVDVTPDNIQQEIYDKLDHDVALAFYSPSDDLWDLDNYHSFYQRIAKYYEDAVQDGTIFAAVDVSKPESQSLMEYFNVAKTPTLFVFPKGRENNLDEVFKLDHDVGPEEIVSVLMESDVGQVAVNLPKEDALNKLLKNREL
ncbi:unnamed protein product [Ambrosiozyma monospora]|uniref:Unnamed protein product n=1 Tax=Ambrosiozyma monospora TaxID=43982 RepID=A0ACB5T5H7_AMBMO|nr:unnamed protein product [Ambrosiozyma monospora]